MKPKIVPICLLFLCFSILFETSSFALDRRFNVLLKTSGVGAGVGAAAGSAAWALGAGDIKSVWIGTSLGLYAGIALAAYILYWPEEKIQTYQRPLDRPRSPVEEDDWQKEDEDTIPEELIERPMLPKGDIRSSIVGTSQFQFAYLSNENSVLSAKTVWIPLLSARF